MKPKQTKKNTSGIFLCLFVGEGESKAGRGKQGREGQGAKAGNGWTGKKGRPGQGKRGRDRGCGQEGKGREQGKPNEKQQNSSKISKSVCQTESRV